MNKEQMKDIMKETAQVANETILDEVIAGMECKFEKLKEDTLKGKLITTMLNMYISPEGSFEGCIEGIINSRWSYLNDREKECVVRYFAEVPQNYPYVEAVFSSGKQPLLHAYDNEFFKDEEIAWEDFISRKDFINRTGIFVSPMYFNLIHNDFIEKGISVDEFVNDYEEKYATCIEELPLSGTFKYEVTDDDVNCVGLFKDGTYFPNIWEIIDYLTREYDHKCKYADEMAEKYHSAVDEVLEEIKGYLSVANDR